MTPTIYEPIPPLLVPPSTKEEDEKALEEAKTESNKVLSTMTGETDNEQTVRTFRYYFHKRENGEVLDSAMTTSFRELITQCRAIVYKEADVVVSTLITSADTVMMENFKPDLVIFQKAGKIGPELLVGLANYPAPCYVGGDVAQLRPFQHECWTNTFAKQINVSLFDTLIQKNAHHFSLFKQYRMVKPIADGVSKAFYDGKLKTMIDEKDRLNHAVVKAMLATHYDINGSSAFFDIRGVTEVVGPTRTKRNNVEVAAVLYLVKQLHKAGIKFKDSTILSSYKAQVTLIRKHIALQGVTDIIKVRIGTVDSFIGEKSSIVILSMAISKNLGFVKDADRLAVAFSRAMDSLIVLNDYSTIEQRRDYDDYNTVVQYYKNIGAFRLFDKPLEPLEDAKIEEDLRKALLATADGYAVNTDDADDAWGAEATEEAPDNAGESFEATSAAVEDPADVENPAIHVMNPPAADDTSGTSSDTAEPAPNWGGERREEEVDW